MTRILELQATTYSNDATNVQALRVPLDNYSHWDPDLEAEIAAAIRQYPDMDAPSWLAPSAVLGIVERRLLERGRLKADSPNPDHQQH